MVWTNFLTRFQGKVENNIPLLDRDSKYKTSTPWMIIMILIIIITCSHIPTQPHPLFPPHNKTLEHNKLVFQCCKSITKFFLSLLFWCIVYFSVHYLRFFFFFASSSSSIFFFFCESPKMDVEVKIVEVTKDITIVE